MKMAFNRDNSPVWRDPAGSLCLTMLDSVPVWDTSPVGKFRDCGQKTGDGGYDYDFNQGEAEFEESFIFML
jgi:hypothetical protein